MLIKLINSSKSVRLAGSSFEQLELRASKDEVCAFFWPAKKKRMQFSVELASTLREVLHQNTGAITAGVAVAGARCQVRSAEESADGKYTVDEWEGRTRTHPLIDWAKSLIGAKCL